MENFKYICTACRTVLSTLTSHICKYKKPTNELLNIKIYTSKYLPLNNDEKLQVLNSIIEQLETKDCSYICIAARREIKNIKQFNKNILPTAALIVEYFYPEFAKYIYKIGKKLDKNYIYGEAFSFDETYSLSDIFEYKIKIVKKFKKKYYG